MGPWWWASLARSACPLKIVLVTDEEEPVSRRAIEVRDIVELMVHWHAGRRIGEVSASLGVDPKTIRKYTAPAIEAGLVPGGPPLSVEQCSLPAGFPSSPIGRLGRRRGRRSNSIGS